MSKLWAPIKRNYKLYSWLKVLRDIGSFPTARLGSLPRLRTIAASYPSTMLPPVRLYNFMDAVDDINQRAIEGAIVECGVWSGGAFAAAALWDDRTSRGIKRAYHGFDSFEGLPPPTDEDKEVKVNFDAASERLGRVVTSKLERTGVCVGDDADSVRVMLSRAGVPMDRTVLHVGWFQNTLPVTKAQIGKIAILRIDGDWYDSTKVCLDELYPQVEPGGWVIIDDYGTFSGCQKAVDEFREAHGIATPITFVDKDCVYFHKPN